MLPRQSQKARRRAYVFIHGVALLIGGNDLPALHIGETRFQLFEGRGDQFAEQFFGGAFGEHIDQRGQARLRFQVQMQDVAGRAQAACGVLFPVLGEFADFHDDLCAAWIGRNAMH